MYVGGTKLGKVAFIGEAKFAPGEWVGVELQEPVGKNDGSVGGVSYFKVCLIKKSLLSQNIIFNPRYTESIYDNIFLYASVQANAWCLFKSFQAYKRKKCRNFQHSST